MSIMVAMKNLLALAHLLSLLALLGMLIAPVGAVAAEYAMADMSAKAAVQMEEMAGDMPCCPDEQPAKPDCDKSCPFVIICSTSAPLALLKAEWTSASISRTDHVFEEHRSTRLRSLAAEPPARPPKA